MGTVWLWLSLVTFTTLIVDPATFRRKSLQFLRFSLNFLMIYYQKIAVPCRAVPCEATQPNLGRGWLTKTI